MRGEERGIGGAPHSSENMLARGGGLGRGGRGQGTLNVNGCFAVCSNGKQCHHVVQLNFTTRTVNKITSEFTLLIIKRGTSSNTRPVNVKEAQFRNV